MTLYVWKDTGGYGASIVVVRADSVEQARDYVARERERRDRVDDVSREAYWEWHRQYKSGTADDRNLTWERWAKETAEGRAWEADTHHELLTSTDDEPMIVNEDETGVVADCHYFE